METTIFFEVFSEADVSLIFHVFVSTIGTLLTFLTPTDDISIIGKKNDIESKMLMSLHLTMISNQGNDQYTLGGPN